MQHILKYTGEAQNGPSYDLWKDCPVSEILADPSKGCHFFDNFVNCPTWTGPAGTLVDKYNVYGDTGVVIGPSGLQGGGLRITHDGTDHDEGAIQVGGGGLLISDTASVSRKLWFEARVRKSTIANDGLAFFLGLMTPASAASDILVDTTGALAASKSYLGFRNLHDNGEELDVVHADSAGSIVEWKANIHTLVANTYVKLGFKFCPGETKRVRFWIDGTEYTTDYMDSTDIALATFPEDDVLAPMFATQIETGSTVFTADMAWWRFAQLAL